MTSPAYKAGDKVNFTKASGNDPSPFALTIKQVFEINDYIFYAVDRVPGGLFLEANLELSHL
jgi:hypothetical protein